MTQTRREHLKFLGATATVTLTPLGAFAASHAADDDTAMAEDGPMVHEVQMLNKHPDDSKERQVFVPDLLRAKVGDTVKFIPADKGHNSECSAKTAPEGATVWRGKINKEVEVVLDTPGAYAYNCKPHRTAGMVGLILVGDVSGNYEDVKGARFRGKEKKRYEAIFERADAMLEEEATAAESS